MLLANQTLLRGNWAPTGNLALLDNPRWAHFQHGPSLAYGLPAPLGHWVPEPFMCDLEGAPDGFREESWARGHEGHRCDYEHNPHIRGLVVAPFANGPSDVAIYPFACPAGTMGNSNATGDQTSPRCAGLCEAGEQPRCGRDASEMQLRRGRDAVKERAPLDSFWIAWLPSLSP